MVHHDHRGHYTTEHHSHKLTIELQLKGYTNLEKQTTYNGLQCYTSEGTIISFNIQKCQDKKCLFNSQSAQLSISNILKTIHCKIKYFFHEPVTIPGKCLCHYNTIKNIIMTLHKLIILSDLSRNSAHYCMVTNN